MKSEKIDDIEIENAEVFNLKISTKGRYGLTIMIELAKNMAKALHH